MAVKKQQSRLTADDVRELVNDIIDERIDDLYTYVDDRFSELDRDGDPEGLVRELRDELRQTLRDVADNI